MSRYNRDTPAYGREFDEFVNPCYAENPHVLKWWTEEHDKLLLSKIQEKQWAWEAEIFKEIAHMTPPEIIETWKKEDPICSQYAWYNVLMYFAISRAQRLKFTKHIRKPQWKVCPLCNHEFIEHSLPFPMIKRLGVEHLDFCAPCLSTRVYQNTGSPTLSAEQTVIYLQDLTNVLQRIPPQGFGEGIEDFHGIDQQERLAILEVLGRKPTTRRVKELFGSWLNALIKAGVLEDGTRKTSRGIHCIAKDGHVCLSLGEKTIDDFLFMHGIVHEKEPSYPERNLRADFSVDGVFIEYFGLVGNPEYDAKTKQKQQICRKCEIHLISIYPKDLVTTKTLEKRLLTILPR